MKKTKLKEKHCQFYEKKKKNSTWKGQNSEEAVMLREKSKAIILTKVNILRK